jgi:uroporphyrinogen-III synthase
MTSPGSAASVESSPCAGALDGRHVVITRPAGQTVHLAEAIAALGGKPVLFPVLEIVDVADITPLLDIALRLDEFDLAVFISPNAANKALDVILPRRSWPASLRVATMGKSSEQELSRYGIEDVIAPRLRFDSEALLELPEMQPMAGRRVIIFRGDGGRELLGDTLTARGATVEYVECYRRRMPRLDPAPLFKLWEDGELDAVTVTSSEGMRNLCAMVGPLGQAWLRKTPLFVPHARIAEQARALGLAAVIATGPGDDGLVDGLIQHFAGCKRPHVE